MSATAPSLEPVGTPFGPLYARVMGSAWSELAEPIRIIHSAGLELRAHGRLRIEHGRSPAARLLAWMLRLPRPSAAADTHLVIRAGRDCEHWLRTFDARRLATRQYAGSGFELVELFGLLESRFRLVASQGSLLYVQREAAFRLGPLRLRIPATWAPRVDAREDPAGPARVEVHVCVTLPGFGPLITYHGFVDVNGTPA